MTEAKVDESAPFEISTLIQILQIMVNLKIHEDEEGSSDSGKTKQDLNEVISYLSDMKKRKNDALIEFLSEVESVPDAIEFLNTLKSETDCNVKKVLAFMANSVIYSPIIQAFINRYSYLLPQKTKLKR